MRSISLLLRLFNPLTNRSWSTLDFILDFRRVNRRMHNKLMVADNAAAIVGGRNIGDICYGVNTIANYRDLDVFTVGPVVRDLSQVFDRYWNSPLDRADRGHRRSRHERNVRVRVLTNSLASNDMLAAHSGYAKTRRRLLENGMELYRAAPGYRRLSVGLVAPFRAVASGLACQGDGLRPRSRVHRQLQPRSAVINTEAGLYIESPELAKWLTAYMATGVLPANSYRVLLDPDGGIIWETVIDGQTVRYRDEPGTGFRRRFVANLLKLLPINSQL